MTEWREIVEFPGYSVSNTGFVRNDVTDRIMRQTPNTHGIPIVGLVKLGEQQKRSVSVLVADAFVTTARSLKFNTPVHLDGDKFNNHMDNLVWRPRWFALQYRQQFAPGAIRQGFNRKIQEIKSGEIFETSWHAVVKYGLLERDIVISILNQTYVPPTYQTFRLYE
jgi:hypothetical protein